MIRKPGYKVPPLSIEKIESLTSDLREAIGHDGGINMIKLFEFVLPGVLPDFEFVVVEDNELGGDSARTYPNKCRIELSMSTYEGALALRGKDNFTLAHELGHLFMHRGIKMAFARGGKMHRVYEDSEWQADTFAASFLMPKGAVLNSCKHAIDIEMKFYVSRQAARNRWKNLKTKSKSGTEILTLSARKPKG